jgi:uncharacterized protein (TIGR02284 family)
MSRASCSARCAGSAARPTRAHRWFMNAKDAITGYDDKRLLEECERGEDYAVKEFRGALGKNLPTDIAQRLQSCFGQVKQSRDEIKRLRNAQS